jgi:hypothetical protein
MRSPPAAAACAFCMDSTDRAAVACSLKRASGGDARRRPRLRRRNGDRPARRAGRPRGARSSASMPALRSSPRPGNARLPAASERGRDCPCGDAAHGAGVGAEACSSYRGFKMTKLEMMSDTHSGYAARHEGGVAMRPDGHARPTAWRPAESLVIQLWSWARSERRTRRSTPGRATAIRGILSCRVAPAGTFRTTGELSCTG